MINRLRAAADVRPQWSPGVPLGRRDGDGAAMAEAREPSRQPRLPQERTGMRPRGNDPHLVALFAPESFETGQYQVLRHALEQTRGGLGVIAISSPAPGDGKTTTAINLAAVLAQASDLRVLLLDADLRWSSAGRYLGLHGGHPGLADLISDPALSLDEVVYRDSVLNFAVLPAGRRPDAVYETLAAPRVGEVLEDARRRYDYIVVDAPPLLAVPDCRVIAKWVDGFVMVVAAHKTPRQLVADALNVLDPAKLIGLVFNGDERPLSGYYGPYYSYGRPANARQAGWWARARNHVAGVFSGRHASPSG